MNIDYTRPKKRRKSARPGLPQSASCAPVPVGNEGAVGSQGSASDKDGVVTEGSDIDEGTFGDEGSVGVQDPADAQILAEVESDSTEFVKEPGSIDVTPETLKLEYSEPEKLAFAEAIIAQYNKNQMNCLCIECQRFYRPERMPLTLWCGHSVCVNCIEQAKSHCKLCTDKDLVGQIGNVIPNRDLLFNAVTFQDAIREVAKETKWSKDLKYTSRSDVVLTGLTDIFRLANSGVEVFSTLEKEYELKIAELNKALELLDEVGEELRISKSNFQGIEDDVQFYEVVSSMIDKTFNYKTRVKLFDDMLIESLGSVRINEAMVLGVRLSEIEFGVKGLHSLATSKYDCFAMLHCSPPMFSRLVTGGNKVCALSFQTNCKFTQNVVVFDYEKLRSTFTATGVFFLLEFENEVCVSLYVDFKEKNLFWKQVVLLCSGERGGATYVGGKGVATEKKIIIQTYTKDNEHCSEDILLGIPDDVGKLCTPVEGMVSAGRMYGSETEMVISRVSENIVVQCIGSLVWGSLSKVPVGEFTIKDCGVLYNV